MNTSTLPELVPVALVRGRAVVPSGEVTVSADGQMLVAETPVCSYCREDAGSAFCCGRAAVEARAAVAEHMASIEPAGGRVAAFDLYERTMAVANAPLTVVCRRCRAFRGLFCQSRSGCTTSFHAVRKADVAGLSDDEKVAAVAALRAGRENTRAAVEATLAQSSPPWAVTA